MVLRGSCPQTDFSPSLSLISCGAAHWHASSLTPGCSRLSGGGGGLVGTLWTHCLSSAFPPSVKKPYDCVGVKSSSLGQTGRWRLCRLGSGTWAASFRPWPLTSDGCGGAGKAVLVDWSTFLNSRWSCWSCRRLVEGDALQRRPECVSVFGGWVSVRVRRRLGLPCALSCFSLFTLLSDFRTKGFLHFVSAGLWLHSSSPDWCHCYTWNTWNTQRQVNSPNIPTSFWNHRLSLSWESELHIQPQRSLKKVIFDWRSISSSPELVFSGRAVL